MSAVGARVFLTSVLASYASAIALPDVSTAYPYTGPAVPIGDWVDPTVNGNGKGFPRLVEAPAVAPALSSPKNNINVVSTSYLPSGINIHFQTPFGLGVAPSVRWGTSSTNLTHTATGYSRTYDRTPPCSEVVVTQCSQFFHDVPLTGLASGTTYYYQILAANGTTTSHTMSVKTARAVGDHGGFSIAVLNDMGYTNARGTHQQLMNAITDGVAFAWHGGDISYADDWYSGILPCESDWPVCYNGTSTELPGPAPVPAEYLVPLPAGETPNQGGPQGGDMSVLYESNWDLWQQWTNNITTQIPYMVLPGNHEATCSEFDGPGNILTAYLSNNQSNATAPTSALTYFSCPPSQRNFTAFQHRFQMSGNESGGVGNFWYSFDYGLAHFVSIDVETDFYQSPEYPFVADLTGNETVPLENQTYVTDSGPFGYINGSYKNNLNYEQYQWLAKDLAAVNRTATPWVVVMGHRPMYSSQVSSYQAHIRNAFEALMLKNGVDAYYAGHIHWYERLYPLGVNGTINTGAIINNSTYMTDPGKSITHIVNGMAGNIESHSTLSSTAKVLNITAVLNYVDYGFSKLDFKNSTVLTLTFVKGADGSAGDSVTLIKKPTASSSVVSSTPSLTKSASATTSSSTNGSRTSTVSVSSAKASSSATKSASASASVTTPKSSSAATLTSRSTSVATPASSHPTVVKTTKSSLTSSATAEASVSSASPALSTESRRPAYVSWSAAPPEFTNGPGFWAGWDQPGSWAGHGHGPRQGDFPSERQDLEDRK